MKTRQFFAALAAVAALGAGAQTTALPVTQLTDSAAFFPQLNADGSRVIFAPTDASQLIMQDVATQRRTTISSNGLPGFNAVWGQDGKVYYVTQEQRKNRLIYRTGHQWDPATGKDKVVLKAQHGAVHVVRGSKGVALVGEHKSWGLDKAGLAAWTQGEKLYIARDGKVSSFTPVTGSCGYLWASISPDGTRVAFTATAKSTYVCDLQGRVLADLGPLTMPSWLDNKHIVAANHSRNIRINGSNILLVNADGSSTPLEISTSGDAIQPAVTGKFIVFTTKKGSVRVIKLNLRDNNE